MGRDLIDRYGERLHGVLSCYDRIVVTGTLPQVCCAQGMTAFVKARGAGIFDYPALCRAAARCDPGSRSGAGDVGGNCD